MFSTRTLTITVLRTQQESTPSTKFPLKLKALIGSGGSGSRVGENGFIWTEIPRWPNA